MKMRNDQKYRHTATYTDAPSGLLEVLLAAEMPLEYAYLSRSVLVQKGSARNEGNFSSVGSTASVRVFLIRPGGGNMDY